MSITCSERPFDMSAWVSEKSDNALESACELVDLLKEIGDKLSSTHQEQIAFELHRIIRNATQLSTFGHEKMDSFGRELVEVMVDQGIKGFRTYKQYVSGTNPLAQSLRSLENFLSLFDQVQKLFTTHPDNKQMLLDKVEHLGKELQKSRFDQVRAVGNDLLKLRERYGTNTLPWSQFVRETTTLLAQGRKTVVRNADNARTALADLDAANISLR